MEEEINIQKARERYDSFIVEITTDLANFEAIYPGLYGKVVNLMTHYERKNGDNNNDPELWDELSRRIDKIEEELKRSGGGK